MDIKCFIVLFVIASVTAKELLDPFDEVKEKCRQQLASATEQKKSELEALAYLFCSAINSPLITKEGLLNEMYATDLMSSVVPRPVANPIIDMCNKEITTSGAKTRLERAIVISKCLIETLDHALSDLEGLVKKLEPVTHFLNLEERF